MFRDFGRVNWFQLFSRQSLMRRLLSAYQAKFITARYTISPGFLQSCEFISVGFHMQGLDDDSRFRP